jgi:hypothetical protein
MTTGSSGKQPRYGCFHPVPARARRATPQIADGAAIPAGLARDRRSIIAWRIGAPAFSRNRFRLKALTCLLASALGPLLDHSSAIARRNSPGKAGNFVVGFLLEPLCLRQLAESALQRSGFPAATCPLLRSPRKSVHLLQRRPCEHDSRFKSRRDRSSTKQVASWRNVSATRPGPCYACGGRRPQRYCRLTLKPALNSATICSGPWCSPIR